MIYLKNVWFRYPGSNSWVLRDINLKVLPNEVIYIVGPNGSGKTTLLKIIGLLYKPTRGYVIVEGKEFWSLSESLKTKLRRDVVYVFEKPILLRRSVIENVAYGLLIRGFRRDEAFRMAENVLNTLGVNYLANRDWYELSAGEAQIVSIARALILRPKILLLDEPFTHLDRAKRSKLIEVISNLKRNGVGIVLTSHIEDTRLPIDKIVYIENGSIHERT